MSSMAELFDKIAPTPAEASGPATATATDAEPVKTPTITDADTAPGRAAAAGWVAGKVSNVRADWQRAWLWDAHGLTVRAVWAARVPDRERVPAGNQALWLGWCVYNHAVLVVLVPLLVAAYLLGHPARLLYLSPLAVAAAALWLT